MSSEDMEISAGVSGSIEHEKVLNIDKLTDTAGKRDDCHVDNESVGPESHVPSQKLERVESSTKETSKDGLSAGSFTHQTQTNWFHECQIPAMSSEDMEITPGVSGSTEHEKVLNVDKLTETVYEGQGGCFKKRRGKRKRKDCARNINEASVRESDFSIVVSRLKESSTSNCGEVVKSSGVTEENTNLKKDGTKDLMAILDSILEIKGASCFCRKHDSQKRQRYKQLIQRHMDFDTIRSRISNKTIDSVVQLFRDMFLLTTNALMFYSKNTRQYKSALLMRDIVKEKLTENRRNVIHSNVDTVCATPSLKVPSVRPCNQKINAAKAADGSDPASGVSNKAKKPRTGGSKENSLSSVKTLHIKKAVGGSKKHEPSTPNLMKEMKEKKRRRTRL
ncbi:bromodomain protein [Medicago truncatula]|nr:bromodomain protein [Medicago truncatula]